MLWLLHPAQGRYSGLSPDTVPGRDEGAKALSQLADRVLANPTPFIGQLLCARTRLAAQGRQVKSGEIKRAVFHAELSQKCLRHATDFARNGLNLVPFGSDPCFQPPRRCSCRTAPRRRPSSGSPGDHAGAHSQHGEGRRPGRGNSSTASVRAFPCSSSKRRE